MATAMPEVTDNGATYTFKLKDGLKYSNGDPIVAADFVRSIRHLADPRNAYDYGYEMCYIAGAKNVLGEDFGCAGDADALQGPHSREAARSTTRRSTACSTSSAPRRRIRQTLVVKLDTPVNFFPNIMAMWLMTPTNEKSTKFAEAADLIASGPFMMDSWTHNSEMVFVPNPNWSGTKPTLTKLVRPSAVTPRPPWRPTRRATSNWSASRAPARGASSRTRT